MIKTYYHGTSMDNFESIMKRGLRPVPAAQRLWYDSYSELIYLWDTHHEERPGFDHAVEMAVNATICAKDKRVLILKIRMSDKDVTGDSSGAGMEEQGAVQCYGVPKKCIIEYSISEDLSPIMPWVLSYYFGFNNASKQPTKLQQWAIKHLNDDGTIGIFSELPIQWEHTILK